MGLIETLLVGSYVWSTTLASVLYRKITGNHLHGIEQRLKNLEDHNPH